MISNYVRNTLFNFLSFFLIAFSLYIFIALVSYDSSDPAFFNKTSSLNINNLGGPLGANVSDFLFTIFGQASFLILLIGIVWALQTIFFKDEYNSRIKIIIRFVSSFILLISFCSILEYYFANNSGGYLGEIVFINLSNALGFIGSLVFLVIFLIPASSLSFNFSWLKTVEFFGSILISIFFKAKSFLITIVNNLFSYINNSLVKLRESRSLKVAEKKEADLLKAKIVSTESKTLNENQIKISNKAPEQPDLPNTGEPKITEVEVKEINKEASQEKTVMPSTALLDRALDDGSSLTQEELSQIASLLETKLDEFGIEASVESVLPGPVVTRFEIQPAPGTKASKITNIAQDIARSLSVSSVRVVEVIEGKSYVGIEIPNTNRKMVRLTEILSSQAFKKSPSNLTLALGHDISGNPVVVDLAKMPHLLVAGTTGSGKSVGVNAMLLSLLFKSDPKDVRLILIDPKMLELSVYDGIPHLLTPVITDMTDASNGLRWCVVEMDRRYKLMSLMGVRNLAGFNKKIQDAAANGKQIINPLHPEDEEYLEELPSIVVVVDEFADMMMLVGKKVEHLIARIAQKARAAGIHLILATQRPSVDVITGLIKANIPTRIGFQVSTKIDSRTILDQGGAEQLLGYGDMLYLPPGVGVPVRVHGAFVGDDEVHRVVNDWKTRAEPDYIDDIVSSAQETGPIPGWSGSETSSSEDADDLYDEAVNFVLESRRASISAVQRKLRIGYNRAARLIETMEESGLVSEMSSNGSREVLVPKRD
ncbi:DNA translocase FtsK 4TM domain-containing protein [Gammaproteobacteria bacterium]|nr:DNA translocase FtsK 4TM domain-containing protein [Gammaproteobacteria bacterium]